MFPIFLWLKQFDGFSKKKAAIYSYSHLHPNGLQCITYVLFLRNLWHSPFQLYKWVSSANINTCQDPKQLVDHSSMSKCCHCFAKWKKVCKSLSNIYRTTTRDSSLHWTQEYRVCFREIQTFKLEYSMFVFSKLF